MKRISKKLSDELALTVARELLPTERTFQAGESVPEWLYEGSIEVPCGCKVIFTTETKVWRDGTTFHVEATNGERNPIQVQVQVQSP